MFFGDVNDFCFECGDFAVKNYFHKISRGGAEGEKNLTTEDTEFHGEKV